LVVCCATCSRFPRRRRPPESNTLTYARLVDELFPRLTGGIRWGLDRTLRLLATVDDPHLKFPSIHVGGTNGKGSASATAAAILRANGARVGLYTSPHLCTFRERIQIDGEPISEAALLAAAERLWPAIQSEFASFFEATTAIGLLALADAEIDVALIEVGLGGRLDSTNVITPLVTVITNISLDHVQLLGNTLEAVAREKAGIVKAGVPLITGESVGPAAGILYATADARSAPVRAVPTSDVTVDAITLAGTTFRVDTRQWGSLALRTPLIGAHQAWNAAIAIAAVETLPSTATLGPLTREAVEAGVANVRWPGRMQVEQVAGGLWIFDVAHNVAGVQALLGALDGLGVPAPRTVLVGVLGDKDWAGMLAPLAHWADRLILTAPPTAPADRRWNLARVAASLPGATETVPDFEDALRAAARSPAHGTVIVTGSFHTVGDALAMLGRCDAGSDVALPEVDLGG
jgi:dihydrofolate synthase / folylpolyglutamate synthase